MVQRARRKRGRLPSLLRELGRREGPTDGEGGTVGRQLDMLMIVLRLLLLLLLGVVVVVVVEVTRL